MILDGFGVNESEYGNAIAQAKTPNLEKLYAKYPSNLGHASGLDVGLPDGQMGNSEVGHLNIGAGRIVYQELTRITKAIEDGDFFTNEALVAAMNNVKEKDSALHLMGLLSDGGVHSHDTHLYALIQLAKKSGIEKVYVHAFLDGRDVPPACAKQYIEALENQMKEIGVGEIATVAGRYYAMDRDKRWERVQLAYDAMVLAEGVTAASAIEAVDNSYAKDEQDEFVKPTVIVKNGTPIATVNADDSVIMFNFRPDRAREITQTFVDADFDGFERKKGFVPVYFVSMTQYDATFKNIHVANKPQTLDNTLGEYLSQKGLKQLRIAETEKYAHVTFFFNGGVETPYEGEERILIPSPKVATYDLQPEMSATEVTEKLVSAVNEDKFDFIVVNYANPDMVGHTGMMDAAIKAVEAVDTDIAKVVDAVLAKGGQILLTADHGNSDEMLDPEGNVITAHSCNPVPLLLIGADPAYSIAEGKLADIAPTLLDLMGIEQPKEMTGKSLLIKK